MSDLTLSQAFGVGATQDSQSLTLKKSDYPLLTPNSSNTAESLLVAILLQALENFRGILTAPNGQPVDDRWGNTIDYDNSSLFDDYINIETYPSYLEQRGNGYVVRATIIITIYSEYADNELS